MNSDTPNFQNDSQAVIEAVERLTRYELIDVGVLSSPAPAIVIPKGKRVESLKPLIDAYRAKPERRKGTVTVDTSDSFVQVANRYAAADLTAIFAKRDASGPWLLAVFDYHKDGESDVTKAEWAGFRARYDFPLSVEWQRWRNQDGETMDGVAFAEFMENNIRDVAVLDGSDGEAEMREFAKLVGGTFASPSQLMDLSRGLAINVSTAVKQAQNLASGEISVLYHEVHNDGEGKPIKVPNLFIIGIPVFDGGPRYRIAARLRYRLVGGRVHWAYSLVQPEASFDHAFDEVVEVVKAKTELPVFYGAPES